MASNFKTRIKALSAMLIALGGLVSCSSDNDTPLPPAYGGENSIMKSFTETYSFGAKEVWNSDTSRNLIIPVRGMVERVSVDFLQIDGESNSYLWYTLRDGVEYSPELNPLWYGKWVKHYGDTTFNRQPVADLENYSPHPYGIESITLRVPQFYNPGELWDPGYSVMYSGDYNENYKIKKDCTSLFRIRFRSIYPYLANGYSWTGTGQTSPWVEMELTEFNAKGGARLMDMTEFYLIAKEAPSLARDQKKRVRRYFDMEVVFENGQKNKVGMTPTVFSCF